MDHSANYGNDQVSFCYGEARGSVTRSLMSSASFCVEMSPCPSPSACVTGHTVDKTLR